MFPFVTAASLCAKDRPRETKPIVKLGLWACVLIVAMMLVNPSAAEADVVVLKNGDRITGFIIKMENKRLQIDPGYADIMKIKWEDVRSITSERPMLVKLFGEVDIPEGVGERRLDRIIVRTLDIGGPIRLEDVRAINFTEQDYRGYISGGGNQTSGNTDTQALNVSGTLTYRKFEHRFILDGKYNRAKAGGTDTANNGAFSSRYDYFVAHRLLAGGLRSRRIGPVSASHRAQCQRTRPGLRCVRPGTSSSQHRCRPCIGVSGLYDGGADDHTFHDMDGAIPIHVPRR